MLNRHSAPHSHRCCFFPFSNSVTISSSSKQFFTLHVCLFQFVAFGKMQFEMFSHSSGDGGLYNRTRIYHIVCSYNHTFIRFLQCAFNLVLLQREFEILKWTTLKFSMGFWVNRFHMIDPIQLEFYFVSSININECILLIRFLIVHGPSAHGPAQKKGKKLFCHWFDGVLIEKV